MLSEKLHAKNYRKCSLRHTSNTNVLSQHFVKLKRNPFVVRMGLNVALRKKLAFNIKRF